MDYCKKTILELKEICSQHKIKGITGKKKNELIDMIKDYNLKYSNLEEAKKQTIAQHLSHTNTQHTTQSYLSISELINKITLGDCIEFMKKLPPNSIDMICTDPPYFLDGLNSDWNKQTLDKKGSSVIVGNLPKGMKFDRNQSKKFNEFYSLVSIEVFRILKPGGSFLSFSSPRLFILSVLSFIALVYFILSKERSYTNGIISLLNHSFKDPSEG